MKIARGVAAGNLTQEIEVRSKDEIGQLMQALKEMRDSLVDTIGQVRDSEAHTRALLNNLIDGVASVDEQGVIRTFNPAAGNGFLVTRKSEIIGQNVSLLFPAARNQGRSRHIDYFKAIRIPKNPKLSGCLTKWRACARMAQRFPWTLRWSRCMTGSIACLSVIMRDISERKLAEEQKARLMAELESANEELRSFAYVVSHDLKAPLRAIGALADWLSTDYVDKFDDEGKEHMRLLVSRVHRMGNLIDGILQYSRVGRVREALVAVDVGEVVKEVIDLLCPAGECYHQCRKSLADGHRGANPYPADISKPAFQRH